MIGSCGESNTRCSASVSSTTPRLGPRCPPVAATLWIRNWRISSARSRNCCWERCCKSAGPRICCSIRPVYLASRRMSTDVILGSMRAAELAEDFPVVTADSDALAAARLLAEHLLPGIVVTDESGTPFAVLHASQVVACTVPKSAQDDPSLAGVLSETMADRAADKLGGKRVRDVLPDHLTN